jgi:hypothetical protein
MRPNNSVRSRELRLIVHVVDDAERRRLVTSPTTRSAAMRLVMSSTTRSAAMQMLTLSARGRLQRR